MKYYNGKGDNGQAFLMDGKARSKGDAVFEVIGGLDELTAQIGMAISANDDELVKKDLRNIQKTLSVLMGVVASTAKPGVLVPFDAQQTLVWLEERVQYYGQGHSLRGFVFSGETVHGACLDVCRTISRRVERDAVRLSTKNENISSSVLAVLNRLSSLFFVMRLHADRPI